MLSNIRGRNKEAEGNRHTGVDTYVRPENPADYCVPQKKPEVTLFSKAIIKMLVRGTLASEIL